MQQNERCTRGEKDALVVSLTLVVLLPPCMVPYIRPSVHYMMRWGCAGFDW